MCNIVNVLDYHRPVHLKMVKIANFLLYILTILFFFFFLAKVLKMANEVTRTRCLSISPILSPTTFLLAFSHSHASLMLPEHVGHGGARGVSIC